MPKTIAAVKADDEPTPKALLAVWIREQITGKSEVNLPELTDAAVLHFRSDQEFVTAFLAEMLRPMVYDLARRVMAQTRPTGDVVELGDELVTKDVVKERAKKMSGKWQRWLEHAGARHVRLFDMTKTDLKLAANERRKRGAAEYELADLWEALAERLEGNERVGERFKAEDIERVRHAISKREEEAA